MVTYSATLDVGRHVVDRLARLLAAHRRRIGTPRGSRALGQVRQAVLVLGWFRERRWVHCLARDAAISPATGYRYLHEGIDALADQAPDLHQVLGRCHRDGLSHIVVDGMLIPTDRLATTTAGADLGQAGKHKTFGGNSGVPVHARRHPAVDLRRRTRLGPRHGRRPHPRPAHPVLGGLPNAPRPSSPNAGTPSATSPSAPAASATSPAPHSSSTTPGNKTAEKTVPVKPAVRVSP